MQPIPEGTRRKYYVQSVVTQKLAEQVGGCSAKDHHTSRSVGKIELGCIWFIWKQRCGREYELGALMIDLLRLFTLGRLPTLRRVQYTRDP